MSTFETKRKKIFQIDLNSDLKEELDFKMLQVLLEFKPVM